ncbi:FHA domain-containing protein [Georgenia phoenicis]|uniref:FHA domain-containing protein n=1 Tax=unclassified Georgenia TaxID=2626815 RepID=UPI0039AFD369
MTVAPAVTCGVCAHPLGEPTDRCPACGAPTGTAAPVAPGALPTLLAGCVRATGGARALAVVVDAVVAVALAALALLDPVLGVAAVLVHVLGTLLALALTGRTLGGLVAGLRTVDLFTGAPLYGRVLTASGGDGVTLDVRRGRDPLRTATTGHTAGRASGSRSRRAAAQPPAAAAQQPTRAAAPQAPAPPSPAGWAPTPPENPALGAGGAGGPAESGSRRGAGAPASPTPGAGASWAPRPAAPAAGTASLPVTPPATTPPPAPGRHAEPAPSQQQGGLTLVTADGGRHVVVGTALLGRNPQPRPGEQVDGLVPLTDLARTVSKTHAALRWDGRTAWVTDRASTNGTFVTDTAGVTRRLEAHAETAAELGSTLHLGDVVLTLTGEGVQR